MWHSATVKGMGQRDNHHVGARLKAIVISGGVAHSDFHFEQVGIHITKILAVCWVVLQNLDP